MRTTTKYLHTSTKESQAKCAAIRDAAGVLGAVVYDMAQAVTNADGEKLLRAKREAVSASISYAQVAESLNLLRTMPFYGARVADSYTELSQWFEVLRGATTFAQWEECRGHIISLRAIFYDRYYQLSDYANEYRIHFGELIVHYRRELAKENRKLLPPVAVPKAVRKETIRSAIKPHILIPQTAATCDNRCLYTLARCHLGRNGITGLQYGFKLTYGIWSRAIAIRSLGRNWYVSSL